MPIMADAAHSQASTLRVDDASALRGSAVDGGVSAVSPGAALGVAEDACVGFLDDLVDDIFAQRRVADENERCVRVTAASAWQQVLEGCAMAMTKGADTMDATLGRGRIGGHAANDFRWQQSLRPPTASASGPRKRRRQPPRQYNRAGAPVILFLERLWELVERQAPWVESQLALFPSSHFRVSAVPTLGRSGEWELPVEDLDAFLQELSRAALLSILSSAVAFVVSANVSFLEKKRLARSKLQMQHVAMCVQNALLAAEEAHDQADSASPGQKPLGAFVHVFQTEVNGTPRSLDEVEEGERLACYNEGIDPAPTQIDRNATGRVKHKPTAESAQKQKMARSIVSLMRTSSMGDASKWGALRKNVLVNEHHVGISVEADMAVQITDRKTSTSQPTKKASVGGGSGQPSVGKPLAGSTPLRASMAEPDTATLSNIFSLGTPRQLSPDELARRNDILAILEREEAHITRKMAVASITAMSIPPYAGPDGKPICENDDGFREYAAANSTVVMTGQTCSVASDSVSGTNDGDSSNKRKSEKRRDKLASTVLMGKTKYDLVLDAPGFDVVEGNLAAKLAPELAIHSPIRRSKGRGPVGKAQPSQSPETVKLLGSSASPNAPHPNYLPRPLETASGHLPQLETSRLAAGVKAVVRGVEKRGPRHSPSRNSRLRLHNYNVPTANGVDEVVSPAPRTPAVPASTPESREHLPPVSPIKASPHRKHVKFSPHASDSSVHEKPSPPQTTPESDTQSRRYPVKQPTWEKRTSPPRVRNRHFMQAQMKRKFVHDSDDPIEGCQEEQDRALSRLHQPPAAPRRNLVQRDDDDE